MLTKKEHALLMFVHRSTRANGFCPTLEEMRVAMEMKSKSGVHDLLTSLQDKGFIRRIPNRTSATEILRLPPDVKQAWLGTEFPPELSIEIIRRADRLGSTPDEIIINGLRAQFGLL